MPRYGIIYASAGVNIIGDILFIAFVMPRFWGLQMARRQKISILGVVCLGFLVIASAIARLVRIVQNGDNYDTTCKTPLFPRQSRTSTNIYAGTGYDPSTWSSVEISTGIFCALTPCIHPLLQQWHQQPHGSSLAHGRLSNLRYRYRQIQDRKAGSRGV